MSTSPTPFRTKLHIAFFRRCLLGLPSSAEGHDGNRITIAYFCLSGLELLGALESVTSEKQRLGWAEWVWSLQRPQGGFSGSTYLQTPTPSSSGTPDPNPPHLPSTYTALLVLALLRADMSRLNLPGLLDFLSSCLESDGSFSPTPIPSPRPPSFESDARMSYCASVILSILSHSPSSAPLLESVWDRKGKKREESEAWLRGCQGWEGGYGQRPGLEAQGGTTYCCTTALHLLSILPPTSPSTSSPSSSSTADAEKESAKSNALCYLTHLQKATSSGGQGGFCGRPGKDEDVCYSFWAGGAIRGEGCFERKRNREWLLDAQSRVGGFGKEAGEFPDPYHSYLGIAALAMIEHDPLCGNPEEDAEEGRQVEKLGLGDLDPAWNVGRGVRRWLEGEMGKI